MMKTFRISVYDCAARFLYTYIAGHLICHFGRIITAISFWYVCQSSTRRRALFNTREKKNMKFRIAVGRLEVSTIYELLDSKIRVFDSLFIMFVRAHTLVRCPV